MVLEKRFIINITATVTAFVIGLCINFFLTPFIVENLGREAYGFIGLSNDFLTYFTLITIALNAMAGRFITIRYVEGRIEEANRYLSSVFFTNLILAVVILGLSTLFVIFIRSIVDIPEELVADVRFLFSLLAVSSVIALLLNTFGIGTFITNRLELNSIRKIIGDLLRAFCLIIPFSVFSPHVWYIGISGVVVALYNGIWNVKFTHRLTPELQIKLAWYDPQKIKDLLSAGLWNLINKLSDVLNHSFDLLIANIFIGAAAMGVYSISKSIPMLVLSLFAMLVSVFAPKITILYAQNKISAIIGDLKESILFHGLLTAVVSAELYLLTPAFYRLWLPSEDTQLLTLLTFLGFCPFGLPYEALWNVFTVTNKVKYTSLELIGESLLMLIIVLSSMQLVESPTTRLYIMAGTRTVLSLLRSLLFLPMYAAKCLGQAMTVFFSNWGISILCTVLAIIAGIPIILMINVDSWGKLVLSATCIFILSCSLFLFLGLRSSQRSQLYSLIKSHISKSI